MIKTGAQKAEQSKVQPKGTTQCVHVLEVRSVYRNKTLSRCTRNLCEGLKSGTDTKD